MKRRGFTILEILVAGIILAAVLAVCLEMLSAVAAQDRAVRTRQTALREAANVMERLGTRRWVELTADGISDAKLSREAQQVLHNAKLEISIDPAGRQGEAKRIAVSISWTGPSGEPARPVKLVAWKYRGVGN